jgi:Lipid A core - O-antigen ligase and related enzymes
VPLPRLGVHGLLAFGGPIQGLFGSRNLLGFVAVIALITFLIEWQARSVSRQVTVYSLVLAALLAVFSGSPTSLAVTALVIVAVLLLALARRTPRPRRRRAHAIVASLAVLALLTAWFLHRPLAHFLSERSGFASRVDLWSAARVWIGRRPVTGWGYFGTWHEDPFPTNIIDLTVGTANDSALNAYVDVAMQLGGVGLLLFCAFAVLALVRAWLAGSDRRSVVYSWLPLVLVALLVESLFESYTLTNVGWVLLVMCAVRAGQERSWRTSIDSTTPIPLPPQFRSPH